MHAYVINKTPKYGTDDEDAQQNAQNLIRFLHNTYQEHINYRGGRYRPAYWTMTIFAKGRMRVREELLHDPNITVTFADGKALINFLLTPKPDILGSMLRQEVVLNGNLNYLYKLAFMAKRLQLKALGSI